MRYFVESLVGSSLLVKQGIYLQTCAHIELVAWRIVQMVEGIDPQSLPEVEKFVKLKLDTRGLVKQLRAAGVKCYAPLGLRILHLAARIEDGLMNRNTAAHGAWRVHLSGQLEVEHYFRDKAKTLKYVSERFTSRAVDYALEDADLILREAVELHDRFNIAGGRYISLTAPRDHSPSVPLNPFNTGNPSKAQLLTSTAFGRG
jgi:hypothetical protein